MGKPKREEQTSDDLKSLMENYLPEGTPDAGETYKLSPPPVKKKEISHEELVQMVVTGPEVIIKEVPGQVQKQEAVTSTPTIDLHFLKVPDAIEETIRFLDSVMDSGQSKKVIIITGKGLGSPNYEARIKPAVEDLLKSRYKKSVREFRNAPPDQGGSGALVITFR